MIKAEKDPQAYQNRAYFDVLLADEQNAANEYEYVFPVKDITPQGPGYQTQVVEYQKASDSE
jgi:hypothetical protein